MSQGHCSIGVSKKTQAEKIFTEKICECAFIKWCGTLIGKKPARVFFWGGGVGTYLFIWLHWALAAACRSFSYGMWNLIPWAGMEPRHPALGVLATGPPGNSHPQGLVGGPQGAGRGLHGPA